MSDMPVAVTLLLAAIHPITLATGIGALVKKWPRPPRPILSLWVVVPLVLNPVLWYFGARLFGWSLSHQGFSAIYLFVVLPMNGALFGLASAPLLWRWLMARPAERAARIGMTVQFATLFLNLAVFSQFPAFTGSNFFQYPW